MLCTHGDTVFPSHSFWATVLHCALTWTQLEQAISFGTKKWPPKSMPEPCVCAKGPVRLRQRLFLAGKAQVHGLSEGRDRRWRSVLGLGLTSPGSILPAQTRWLPSSPRQTSGIWRVHMYPVTQQRVNSPGTGPSLCRAIWSNFFT